MTRAIIESKVDNYHYKIRIPLLNKLSSSIGATPTSELATATLSVLPGNSPSFKTGDIVYVAFEEGDTSKPVILGSLLNDAAYRVASDIHTNSLIVDVNAELPADTQIGQVSADSISYLQGLSLNAQIEFEHNNSQHAEFSEELNTFQTSINTFSSTLTSLANNVSQLSEQISNLLTRINNLQEELEKLQEGPLILNTESYGTAEPETITNPVEGQLYLQIISE